MSSHLYTVVGALVCAALALYSGYRVWQSLSRGEAAIDFNFLWAFFTGGDTNTVNASNTLGFSRVDFPRVFWLVVAFWGCLGALMAMFVVGILRSGIH